MILEIAQYVLLSALIFFAVWYVSDWRKGEGRVHATWVAALKVGTVTHALRKAYRGFADKDRFMIFWLQVLRLKKEVPEGAFAELGVYRGDTAKILLAMDAERELFLFDTFEGFIKVDIEAEEGDAAHYSTASFADTSVSLLLERLGNSEKLKIYKGDFAEISASLPETKFALVSMDVDLAKPTLAGLEYFYPRMLPGGVLIIHDYNPKWPSLMKSVDGFLERIPESGIAMPDRECSMIIVKQKR
ncbi:MAG: hypothetical protein CVT92_04315 [Bacteroidetes bacterium HGW-Bacteroidetes-1]|jgi:O-methyltransferase|nr:MAG: hypothetical protein CVT92_04315 [Bacteroidetes bacterium HGW-Bacteroidetes-1]